MTISEYQGGFSGGASATELELRDASVDALPLAPQPALRSAKRYASEARARRTREEYAKQWHAFAEWCATNGLCELPAAPQTLCLYLAARADEGRRVATLAQALAAISETHQVAGHKTPRTDRLVRETWRGIRRRLGVAPDQKLPIDANDVRKMIHALPTRLLGVRDRALLTVGFAGGFRRSELVALDGADLAFVAEGLEVLVRGTKTDQEGEGMTKMLAYGSDQATCPVRSLQDWLQLAGIGEGPVFRSVNRHERVSDQRLTDHSVAVIVKRAAKKAGLAAELFSGHSLRAGFVAEAKKNGADDAAIMDQTGHKSLAMVNGYLRRTKKWEKPASARLGL